MVDRVCTIFYVFFYFFERWEIWARRAAEEVWLTGPVRFSVIFLHLLGGGEFGARWAAEVVW